MSRRWDLVAKKCQLLKTKTAITNWFLFSYSGCYVAQLGLVFVLFNALYCFVIHYISNV